MVSINETAGAGSQIHVAFQLHIPGQVTFPKSSTPCFLIFHLPLFARGPSEARTPCDLCSNLMQGWERAGRQHVHAVRTRGCCTVLAGQQLCQPSVVHQKIG